MDFTPDITPKLIKRTSDGVAVTWRDGHQGTYSYAYLRRNCPCAQCRNSPPRVVEADDALRLIDDKPISIDEASLVGNYAVRFVWNDGHALGLYTFHHLRQLCPCSKCDSVPAT